MLDINDHTPVFSQREYSAAVVENLPLFPPAPILQLTALDADEEENSAIAYTIVAGDDQSESKENIVLGLPGKNIKVFIKI